MMIGAFKLGMLFESLKHNRLLKKIIITTICILLKSHE